MVQVNGLITHYCRLGFSSLRPESWLLLAGGPFTNLPRCCSRDSQITSEVTSGKSVSWAGPSSWIRVHQADTVVDQPSLSQQQSRRGFLLSGTLLKSEIIRLYNVCSIEPYEKIEIDRGGALNSHRAWLEYSSVKVEPTRAYPRGMSRHPEPILWEVEQARSHPRWGRDTPSPSSVRVEQDRGTRNLTRKITDLNWLGKFWLVDY